MHIFPELRISLSSSAPGPATVTCEDFTTYLTGFADYALVLVSMEGEGEEKFGMAMIFSSPLLHRKSRIALHRRLHKLRPFLQLLLDREEAKISTKELSQELSQESLYCYWFLRLSSS